MNGIIVGADFLHEWIFPWWWAHYSRHNSYPVAFFDFGLSPKMRRWCQDRGQVIDLPEIQGIQTREEMDPEIIAQIESVFKNPGWESREAWFKKPFACQLSPFEKTIWIDLDCKINGPLAPLFSHASGPQGISMRKDFTPYSQLPYEVYQAGLIVFRKTEILNEWVRRVPLENGLFRSDQELISSILKENGGLDDELPRIYNWGRTEGANPEALITHLFGEPGKQLIRLFLQEMQLSP